MTIFGTFIYIKDVLSTDVSSFSWVPIFSFSFVVFTASWGLLTLPFLVVTEILPEKVIYIKLSLYSKLIFFLNYSYDRLGQHFALQFYGLLHF